MGGTASRSAPMACEVKTVSPYSKVVRSRRVLNVGKLFFGGLVCDVEVMPTCFDKDRLADVLVISLVIDFGLCRHIKSLAGIRVSLEILDATGQHTVFHKDSNKEDADFCRMTMFVRRRELEASSCVCSRLDEFNVRCTLEWKQHATKTPRLLGFSFKRTALLEPSQVAMDGSYTLTVRSFSKLTAALRDEGEGIYSTHFAIGGRRWYLKFCPRFYGLSFLCLGIGPMGKDEMRTTAEFSFELKGVVNHESHKMRHTFDRDNDDFFYDLEQIKRMSLMHDDRLDVRCYLTVVVVEETLADGPMCSSESVFTPLLSAMHG